MDEIQCPHCPRTFPNERGIRTHISQIHPEHSVRKPFVYVRKTPIRRFKKLKVLSETKDRLMVLGEPGESIDEILNRVLEKFEEDRNGKKET